MKINIAKQTGILSLPQDVATLENITEDGRFHYVVKYQVDIRKALGAKSPIVKIQASLVSPNVRNVQSFMRLNSQEIIQNLLGREGEQVEINRAFPNNCIGTVISDITCKIPNSSTGEFKSGDPRALFKQKGFSLVKASDLTSKNISQPTFQTPLFQPQRDAISQNLAAAEHAYNLILQYGIDPAIAGQRTTLVADTERVHAGILQHPMGIAKEALAPNPAGSLRSSFGLLTSILGDPKSKPSNQVGLADSDYTHVQTIQESNSVTIEEDLFLNVGDLRDEFHLTFQLQDTNGIESERVTVPVAHSRNLAIFTLPHQPPFMTGRQVDGSNRLELKQIDPNGAGIFLFRKVLDLHSVTTESNYVQVAKIPLRVQDGTKWYVDSNPGMRPVLYRAIAYNRAELKSGEFSSLVIKPSQKVHMVQANSRQRKLFISLNAKIIGKTVQLEMADMPTGVSSMQVYRRDLSRQQKASDSVMIGNLILMPNLSDGSGRFYVTDTSPIDQRIYEYSVLLGFRDGAEFWATTPTTIHYNPASNNILATTATPIKAVNVGSELDVQFTLSTVIVDGKVDQIKKAMAQQGILGLFQDDLVQNRDLLQNLVAYQVKRTNITTSEVEDLGVFIGTVFSDQQVGGAKGAKKIKPGHAYEYTITTHFRSAPSLLATFSTTVVNKINPAHSYSYLPSKWHHPITLSQGSLVSLQSMQRNHAGSDFTIGLVGDIIHIRISLASISPSIHKAEAFPLGRGKVMVQWEIKGEAKQFDHFLVTKEEMGMRTIVGKVHALTDSTNIQFVDVAMGHGSSSANPRKNQPIKPTNGSIYEIAATYQITPVLFDYSHGTSIQTPQVITKKIR